MLERRFPNCSTDGDRLLIEITPKLSLLNSIAEMVETFGEDNGIPDQRIFIVNLEIDELITNYVQHSLHKVTNPRLELTLRLVEQSKLVLTLVDTGPPFDPTEDAPAPNLDADLEHRDIGGLGLHLVRTNCDRMHHEVIDKKFNRVTVEHDLHEGEARPQAANAEVTT